MTEINQFSEKQQRVALAWGPAYYDAVAPFSPGENYPEYPFPEAVAGCGKNHVYTTVRESLRLLNMDIEHYGSQDWNPLGQLIHPGQTVVLKPNFVRNFRESDPTDGDCLITHGCILRAIVDYAYLALRGQGRIVIADAPQNDANFSRIRNITGLDKIQEFYQRQADYRVEVYDLRPERAEKIGGVIVGHQSLPGDPQGYVSVNVGRFSSFMEINHLCHRLYGAEYDVEELHRHHSDDVHEYLISKTILDADCVISLPKLKTHKKTGITVNLKNLVGINGNKNWLPHHREGTISQGGDQFSEDSVKRRMEQKVVAWFKRVFPILGPLRSVVASPIKKAGGFIFGDTNTDTVRSGNWYGNDTTWRMVLDLNRILMYADTNGMMHDYPVRRFFSMVDGIVAGEGNGPLDPTPRAIGVVLAGFNPVAVDIACASLIGFDYHAIPMLHRALNRHALSLAEFSVENITINSNNDRFIGSIDQLLRQNLQFKPHFGWQGHIEVPREYEKGMVS